MNNQRYLALIVLMVSGFLWSGCAVQQSVVDIKQHPTQDVTLIQTYETGPLYSGYRFWHCTQKGDDLVCDRTCGVGIECPGALGIIRVDRSPTAQMGGPGVNRQSVAEEAPEQAEEPVVEEGSVEEESVDELADEETADSYDDDEVEQ